MAIPQLAQLIASSFVHAARPRLSTDSLRQDKTLIGLGSSSPDKTHVPQGAAIARLRL
jgi:hypothetical protein